LLPAGSATPGLPAVGGALGGAPGWSLLSLAAAQAHAFAAVVMEEGTGALLSRTHRESRRVGRLVSAGRMRSPVAEFGPRSVELALERAAVRGEPLVAPRQRRRVATGAPPAAASGDRRRPIRDDPAAMAYERRNLVPSDHPVAAVIGAAIDPRPSVPKLPLRTRLRAFVALIVAGLLFLLRALAPARRQAVSPASRMVYVVDDDPDQASLIGGFLGSRDIPFRTFGDGLEAVAAAARERPAAVVLDLGLPWLDGGEIGKVLERISGATILLATALPTSLARARGGGGELLTKPLDLERLADRLQRCLPRAPADPVHRRRSG
ncbi:MAG TPA: response regulator, partial [Vulgatibacter sp.]